MRNYNIPPVVWGGDPLCEHEWFDAGGGLIHENRNFQTGTQEQVHAQRPLTHIKKYDAIGSSFCHKCGAWLGSLGLEPTPELYVEHIVEVFREVRRVLRDDGTLWLNMGSSYAGSWGDSGHRPERSGIAGHQREKSTEWFERRGHPQSNKPPTVLGKHPVFKPKDLVPIPWMVAMALQADGAADPKAMRIIQRIRYALLEDYDNWAEVPQSVGHEIERLDEEYAQAKDGSWWLRSDIIWHKPNCMPESVRDRPTKSHEYVFLMSKSKRYYYDQDAIREATQNPKADFKRVLADVEGGAKKHVQGGVQSFQTKNLEAVRARIYSGRNKRTVWTIPTYPFPQAHFATFPPKLVEPMIKAGTSERGACPECGKAWRRVVELGRVQSKGGGYVRHKGNPNKLTGGKTKTVMIQREHHTIGWRPACDCCDCTGWGCPNCDPEQTLPCLVLDPFAGAGTTLMVADGLGWDWLGIEINPDYVEMALERIAGDRKKRAQLTLL